MVWSARIGKGKDQNLSRLRNDGRVRVNERRHLVIHAWRSLRTILRQMNTTCSELHPRAALSLTLRKRAIDRVTRMTRHKRG